MWVGVGLPRGYRSLRWKSAAHSPETFSGSSLDGIGCLDEAWRYHRFNMPYASLRSGVFSCGFSSLTHISSAAVYYQWWESIDNDFCTSRISVKAWL